MPVGDVPLTPIIDTVTGSVTEIGRIFLRTLTAAANALAPIDAAYWTSKATAGLSAEVNLGALASGYLKLASAIGIATPTTVPTIPQADIAGLAATLAGLAPLASPALTGVPTAPTAAPGTNTAQLATTAFVRANAAGGIWQNQPFNAAHYSAAGGGSWTVGAAAVITNRYCLIGKVLFWQLYISWFSGANVLAGTVTALQIAYPGGLSSAGGPCAVPVPYLVDGTIQAGYAAPSGGVIQINRYNANWAAAAPGLITTFVLEVA
jgi:hypothetical protein